VNLNETSAYLCEAESLQFFYDRERRILCVNSIITNDSTDNHNV
jgi:hypothetical protein